MQPGDPKHALPNDVKLRAPPCQKQGLVLSLSLFFVVDIMTSAFTKDRWSQRVPSSREESPYVWNDIEKNTPDQSGRLCREREADSACVPTSCCLHSMLHRRVQIEQELTTGTRRNCCGGSSKARSAINLSFVV